MKDVKDVNVKALKSACKSLNEINLTDNIRHVGVKGEIILNNFIQAIEKIVEEMSVEDQERIPEDVIDFYNDLIGDEVEEEPISEEQVEAVEEIAEETVEEIKEGPEDEGAGEVVKEEPITEPKPKAKKPKKASTSIRVGRTSYADFDAYKKSLLEEGPITPTNYLDLVLLDGATLQEVVDLFSAFCEDNKFTHGGYKRASQVLEHIEARKNNAGFLYEVKGDVYKFVGATVGVKG